MRQRTLEVTDFGLAFLPDISRVLAEEGIFVCSGIIAENKQTVIAAMENIGFEILETATQEEWVVIVGRLKAKGVRRVELRAGGTAQRAKR